MPTFKITVFGVNEPIIIDAPTEQEALESAISQLGTTDLTGDIELISE